MKKRFKNAGIILFSGILPVLAIAQNNAPDPFADPFAGGQAAPETAANPFGSPNAAPANPFGAPQTETATNPFAANQGGNAAPANPFGAPAQPEVAPDPFGSPAQQQPAAQNQAPANPFGSPAAPTNQTPANPFGSPNTAPPQPANQAPANPFGSPSSNQQPANPFGNPGQQPANPFGSPAAPTNNQPPANPFGAPSNNAPAGGNNAAPTSPFGGGGNPTPQSPFGNQQPPTNTAAAPPSSGNQSPFGGGAVSSPFGNDQATGGGANPFDTVASNPFGETIEDFSTPFDGEVGTISDVSGVAAEYQSLNQLFEFRYDVITRWDGTQFVTRRQLTKEQAQEFDDLATARHEYLMTSRPYPGYDPAIPADIWAEWAHYADQLELWSRYVDKTVLASATVTSAYENIIWPGLLPGDLAAASSFAPGGAGGPEGENSGEGATGGAGGGAAGGDGVPASVNQPGPNNIINNAQSQTLDAQAGEFFDFSSGSGGGQQEQQSAFFDRNSITDQVVEAYSNKLEELRALEKQQETDFMAFMDRLADRRTRRLAYADWINDQETKIEETALDWNRRYNGTVADIGGVRYELYRPGQVPENVQRDAVVVVTDFALTPYDILNPEDGTLKE